MKPGMVTQIRVNPKDCLAILDLMVAMGIDPYDGRSFAQCVSLSLSSLIGVARRGGIIPTEDDGFQYMNRMAPFLNGKNDKRKYRYDQELFNRAVNGVSAPELPVIGQHPGQYIPEHIAGSSGPVGFTESGATSSAAQPLLMDEETLRILREELASLYDKINSGQALSEEEDARFKYLNNQLFQ